MTAGCLATDAYTGEGIEIICEAPADTHQPVIYPAGIVAASQEQDAAASFLEFLQSDEATEIFAKYTHLRCFDHGFSLILDIDQGGYMCYSHYICSRTAAAPSCDAREKGKRYRRRTLFSLPMVLPPTVVGFFPADEDLGPTNAGRFTCLH